MDLDLGQEASSASSRMNTSSTVLILDGEPVLFSTAAASEDPAAGGGDILQQALREVGSDEQDAHGNVAATTSPSCWTTTRWPRP